MVHLTFHLHMIIIKLMNEFLGIRANALGHSRSREPQGSQKVSQE